MNDKYLYKIGVFLSVSILFAYIITLYIANGLPIYPDEIAARLDHSRIGYDFPYKTGLTPMCRHTMLAYPSLWYLPAWVEWLIHGQIQNLTHLRIHGLVGSGLLLILLLFKLSQKQINPAVPIYKNLSFLLMGMAWILGVLCIGVMPFFLVTLRFEQTILCCLLVQLLLFSLSLKTTSERIIAVLLYFFSASIMLYQHPKALFLTPILILVGCQLFARLKKNIVYLLWILLIMIIITNYHIWVQMVDCSASPNVAAIYSAATVNFKNIWYHPTLFFSELGHSISNYRPELIHLRFQPNSEIGYLPHVSLTGFVRIFNKLIVFNYFALVLSVLFLTVRSYYHDLQHKKFLTPHLLVLELLFCAFLNFSLNLCKHWYDAGYLWALLVCAAVVYVSEHISWLIKQKATYVIFSYVLLVGIVSQYILISNYWQPFHNGFEGPSISLHNYDPTKTDGVFEKLSLACQIDRKKAQYIIIDDATYLYFQQAPYPLAVTYILMGNDQNFLNQFGSKYPIDGMVVRARYLPEILQKKYAIKIDDFICVPKSNIKPLFSEWVVERI